MAKGSVSRIRSLCNNVFWEVREMGVGKHYLLTFEVGSIEETFNESILSNALIWCRGFPLKNGNSAQISGFSGEIAKFVMADDSWIIGKIYQRPQRGCEESPVHRALKPHLRQSSHILDSQRCLQIDKLKQTRKSHGAPFRPSDKESVVLCICVCSNKKVQFRGSHFISDERKKERRSSFPYSLFQLLRSDFHVLSHLLLE